MYIHVPSHKVMSLLALALEEMLLKCFLPYMGVAAILIMSQGPLNPFTARNTPGENMPILMLLWCYNNNFIQNHNHCWDLHQFFSCLFETFGTMSEIMFSSDSMSKKLFSTAENT